LGHPLLVFEDRVAYGVAYFSAQSAHNVHVTVYKFQNEVEF